MRSNFAQVDRALALLACWAIRQDAKGGGNWDGSGCYIIATISTLSTLRGSHLRLGALDLITRF